MKINTDLVNKIARERVATDQFLSAVGDSVQQLLLKKPDVVSVEAPMVKQHDCEVEEHQLVPVPNTDVTFC